MTSKSPLALGDAIDPEQRRMLRDHLDALFRDMDAGKDEDMDEERFAAFLDDALADAARLEPPPGLAVDRWRILCDIHREIIEDCSPCRFTSPPRSNSALKRSRRKRSAIRSRC
jgi:hypothetical protein